jgi:hypothetical protein
MLLEKALSEAMMTQSSISSAGTGVAASPEEDAKRDEQLRRKATYKVALGEFSDCCGTTEAEMSRSFAAEQNHNFSDSFHSMLRRASVHQSALG